MELTRDFFVCMDCGRRFEDEGQCADCKEPLLDVRKFEVKKACLDDDDRRKAKRTQTLSGISVGIGLVLVVALQFLFGEWGALIPGFRGPFGTVLYGILLALGVLAILKKKFPAERRFPWLTSDMLVEPSVPTHPDTNDYRGQR